jgi:hypothetical protein
VEPKTLKRVCRLYDPTDFEIGVFGAWEKWRRLFELSSNLLVQELWLPKEVVGYKFCRKHGKDCSRTKFIGISVGMVCSDSRNKDKPRRRH